MKEGQLPSILVVDDNQDNTDIIQHYLEVRGYPITVAHDGDEALALFETVRPNLVLLDVMMPGRDGWEATRQVKMVPELAETPVIALTAHAMTGDRERAFAGCESPATSSSAGSRTVIPGRFSPW